MSNQPIHVQFRPDELPPRQSRSRDILWAAVGVAAVAVAVVVFVQLLPFLLAVLAVAALLAALSTWKAARRRRAWRRQGSPAPEVGAKTYFSFLAAWFAGLLLLVPLLAFSVAVALVVLAIAAAAVAIGIVASLFRSD